MRYDQPFFVGANNERFPHRSIDGYLPALEPKEEIETEQPEEPQVRERWIKSQWHKVLSMEVEMERLRRTAYKYLKEMRELANASKRKTNRYTKYTSE